MHQLLHTQRSSELFALRFRPNSLLPVMQVYPSAPGWQVKPVSHVTAAAGEHSARQCARLLSGNRGGGDTEFLEIRRCYLTISRPLYPSTICGKPWMKLVKSLDVTISPICYALRVKVAPRSRLCFLIRLPKHVQPVCSILTLVRELPWASGWNGMLTKKHGKPSSTPQVCRKRNPEDTYRTCPQ